jgi:hypothetical protein
MRGRKYSAVVFTKYAIQSYFDSIRSKRKHSKYVFPRIDLTRARVRDPLRTCCTCVHPPDALYAPLDGFNVDDLTLSKGIIIAYEQFRVLEISSAKLILFYY